MNFKKYNPQDPIDITAEWAFPKSEERGYQNRESDLEYVESFSAWLDAQGDALADPDSFSEWLHQNDDAIQ